ncbi:MAG: protease modulator HflC [Pseudomonadales bacterium]|nr:protease modulator HflC [Pseudomonadales bacterium]MCP5183298.1 protease modulator HflC [Pseudomonadales bacterium]
MNNRSLLTVIVLGVLGMVAYNSFFVVKQTERAVLLRFGAVKEADITPGIYFRWVIAEEVKRFDGRILTLNAEAERYYTLEKKPLMVDSFVKWRIADVAAFYKATSGDEIAATRILAERVNEGLRNQISKRDMHEVISGKRDELMQELTESLDTVMRAAAGVEVIDVRVKKIDLPQEVSQEVYNRMASERQIEAKRYRAQGDELAKGIRADAERQTLVIEANAYRDSERIRGDGDARAAAIYAEAYNKDPDFYAFYRSLGAYTRVFKGKDDVLVVDPSSDFFKYLKNHGG